MKTEPAPRLHLVISEEEGGSYVVVQRYSPADNVFPASKTFAFTNSTDMMKWLRTFLPEVYAPKINPMIDPLRGVYGTPAPDPADGFFVNVPPEPEDYIK